MSPDPRKPLVTIAIPNYNMGEYIGGAIESALSQTFTDFELLIVNNVSTDNSWEIVKHYEKLDPRIKAVNLTEHIALPIRTGTDALIWHRVTTSSFYMLTTY